MGPPDRRGLHVRQDQAGPGGSGPCRRGVAASRRALLPARAPVGRPGRRPRRGGPLRGERDDRGDLPVRRRWLSTVGKWVVCIGGLAVSRATFNQWFRKEET